MTEFNYEIIENSNQPEVKFISEQLIIFNNTQFGPSTRKELSVVAKDSKGLIQGGLSGNLNWGWFYIQIMWVSDEFRSQGIGAHLLEEIEKKAMTQNCVGIWLDTFSKEAKVFYEKNGYTEFGRLENFPPGNQRYFLQKIFQKK